MINTSITALKGLYVKHQLAKNVHKGEDAWTQQKDMVWGAGPEGGGASLSLFGIFDGHGGKQAATFAAKHVAEQLLQQLGSASEPGKEQQHSLPAELEPYAEQLAQGAQQAWQLQDQLAARLPQALHDAFAALQQQFYQHCKVSGTTGTVAVLLGWDLLVANVGDSSAFLDTGAEVVQVSGNHRLDDSRAERARCEAAGHEVSASLLEGKPVGPKRVWPGGLAMSRTIGDLEAGSVVLCEPEVRQVTLPGTGGRVIIASDGLWDAVTPKTAAHHVRGMPAGKAAKELASLALKARGLRDDITILVVDALPCAEAKLPPLLSKPVNGVPPDTSAAGVIDWHRPLEEAAGAAQCLEKTWQRRIAAAHASLTPPVSMELSGSASEASEGTHLAGSLGEASSAEEQGLSTEWRPSGVEAGAFGPLDNEADDWETVPQKAKPAPAQPSVPSSAIIQARNSPLQGPDEQLWSAVSAKLASSAAAQPAQPGKHAGTRGGEGSRASGPGCRSLRAQRQRKQDRPLGSMGTEVSGPESGRQPRKAPRRQPPPPAPQQQLQGFPVPSKPEQLQQQQQGTGPRNSRPRGGAGSRNNPSAAAAGRGKVLEVPMRREGGPFAKQAAHDHQQQQRRQARPQGGHGEPGQQAPQQRGSRRRPHGRWQHQQPGVGPQQPAPASAAGGLVFGSWGDAEL